jgi:hypothetical protein
LIVATGGPPVASKKEATGGPPVATEEDAMPALHLRVGLLLASLVLCLVPPAAGAAHPKTEDYDGKVVALAEVLAKDGVTLDKDARPSALALVTDDGKVYPLVKDDGSRLFFKDERLLNRRMRLTGRVLPDVGMLQVVQVHSWRKGQLHDVYYWCDVCSIRRGEKGICDCCGGPLLLREEPVQK